MWLIVEQRAGQVWQRLAGSMTSLALQGGRGGRRGSRVGTADDSAGIRFDGGALKILAVLR
jgi:hypothetical protein